MSTKYNLKNESDRIRLKLCIQTLNNCKKRKIYAVVIETSRDIKVSNKLKNLTTILIRKKGISMGEGRRMAIRNAKKAGAEIIILLDPEKEDFIKSINKITDYLIKKDYDIIIP